MAWALVLSLERLLTQGDDILSQELTFINKNHSSVQTPGHAFIHLEVNNI